MSQIPVLRILDASLNRAAEGLRVVEDYLRFVRNDVYLTQSFKALRHDLAKAMKRLPTEELHAARDTRGDVGTAITHEREGRRQVEADVCRANLKRAEQSLRSLEEFGKMIDGEFATQMESLRYRLYTLEKLIDVVRVSNERMSLARLCVLIDGRKTMDEFTTLVCQLVEAGTPMIQLRDKHLPDAELIERARQMCQICRSPYLNSWPPGPVHYATLSIVNDRPDIAAAVDADGVHLGQDDMAVKDARAIVGPTRLVGVSTHNIEHARAAILDGANYLGAGPTFTSTTKTFDQFAGLGYLREVAQETQLPTFAIGGITAKNVNDVLATGITRIAVSGAVTSAPNPHSAATELLSMLNAPQPLAV